MVNNNIIAEDKIFKSYFNLFNNVYLTKETVYNYYLLQKDQIDLFKKEILTNLSSLQNDNSKLFYIEKIKNSIQNVFNEKDFSIESHVKLLRNDINKWCSTYNTHFPEVMRDYSNKLNEILDEEPIEIKKHYQHIPDINTIRSDFYYFFFYDSLNQINNFILYCMNKINVPISSNKSNILSFDDAFKPILDFFNNIVICYAVKLNSYNCDILSFNKLNSLPDYKTHVRQLFINIFSSIFSSINQLSIDLQLKHLTHIIDNFNILEGFIINDELKYDSVSDSYFYKSFKNINWISLPYMQINNVPANIYSIDEDDYYNLDDFRNTSVNDYAIFYLDIIVENKKMLSSQIEKLYPQLYDLSIDNPSSSNTITPDSYNNPPPTLKNKDILKSPYSIDVLLLIADKFCDDKFFSKKSKKNFTLPFTGANIDDNFSKIKYLETYHKDKPNKSLFYFFICMILYKDQSDDKQQLKNSDFNKIKKCFVDKNDNSLIIKRNNNDKKPIKKRKEIATFFRQFINS